MVMVLLGLVTIIATSVTLIVNRSQQKYQIDSKSQAEILKLETSFKDWLMLHDSKEFSLGALSTSSTDISAIQFTYTDNAETSLKMEFANGTLSYQTIDNDNPLDINFTAISDITFTFYGNSVCCIAYIGNTDYTHKILYTMRAAQIQGELIQEGEENE